MNSTVSLCTIQSVTGKRQDEEVYVCVCRGGGCKATLKLFPLKQCRYSPCQGLLFIRSCTHGHNLLPSSLDPLMHTHFHAQIGFQYNINSEVRWGPHLKQNFHYIFRLSCVIETYLLILSLSEGNPA